MFDKRGRAHVITLSQWFGVSGRWRRSMIAFGVELRWIVLVGMEFWTVPSAAQFPEKFTNLKVLPKDISRAELQSTMRTCDVSIAMSRKRPGRSSRWTSQ